MCPFINPSFRYHCYVIITISAIGNFLHCLLLTLNDKLLQNLYKKIFLKGFSKSVTSTVEMSNSFLGKIFPKKKATRSRASDDSSEGGEMEISAPTGVTHNCHVKVDPSTGEFLGLPQTWLMWLKNSNIRWCIGWESHDYRMNLKWIWGKYQVNFRRMRHILNIIHGVRRWIFCNYQVYILQILGKYVFGKYWISN